ncbi:MAG: glycosyltransferase family 4 protein [Planctomycetota bacterium]
MVEGQDVCAVAERPKGEGASSELGQAALGSGVTVWCHDAEGSHPYLGQLQGELRGLGVEVASAPGFWVMRHVKPRRGSVLHLHWLNRYVASQTRLKALGKTLAFVLQLVWLRVRGVRLVWTLHNLKNHQNDMPWIDRFGSTAIAHLCHVLIAHCGAASSEACRRFRVSRQKVHVIPHGHFMTVYDDPQRADRESDDPAARRRAKASARQRLGLGVEDEVYLAFGMIRPYKGLDGLVEAFACFREGDDQDGVGRRRELVIAGGLHHRADPDWPEHVRSRFPWVRLHIGHVPDEEVAAYFDAADVAVFPYRDVLTSGAVILAMGFSLPCVAPRRGCLPETLGAVGAAWFDPAADGALERALLEVAERRASWPEMGANNRAHAKALDWSSIARDTLTVYRGEKKAASHG